MKIFITLSVCRQMNGEDVLIRTEKAFKNAGAADQLVKQLNKNYQTPEGKYKIMKIPTDHGEIDCYSTAGAFEVELEE